MKKAILACIGILATGLGIWLLVNIKEPALPNTALRSESGSTPAVVDRVQSTSAPVEKLKTVAVVRPAANTMTVTSTAGLISVPASQHVNADGLVLEEDLAASDGSIRVQKKYSYNADKILTKELEIRVADGAITMVDYLIASDGKVTVRVTDEKGNATIE